jgi:hypothetical protein
MPTLSEQKPLRTLGDGETPEKDVRLSNLQLVTLAVLLAGGDSAPVDTEDVAIKASGMAPGRFTWRKYKDQINIDIVRKRLWDARRPDRNGWLMGSEREGWTLTQKGLDFARGAASRLGNVNVESERRTLKERQWLNSERRRLIGSEASQVYRREGPGGITRRQAEAFFRLDDYVMGTLRERKIVRLLKAFSNDPELGEVVRASAAALRDSGA